MNFFALKLNLIVLILRRQQEVGQSPTSFHSLPILPPLGPASAQHPAQRSQTGPETAAGCSHGRPRHRDPSACSGCNYPSTDRTGLPTGRATCLSPYPLTTAHTDHLSYAGLQDGQCGSNCGGQSRSSNRLVLMVKPVLRFLFLSKLT